MRRAARAGHHSAPLVVTLLATAALLLASTTSPVRAQSGTIPAPESALGFRVGDDFKLATYDESLAYFRRLDAASDRLQLVEVGRTSMGKPWFFALVSSPENLANVEHYRQIAQRLAHPEGLTDDEAHRLAREGKAFVHIDGGLHASEVAGAQHTIQLAHDLLANADEPKVRAILDDVILMLWPSINPDGQNIVVDWYRENVGTAYEVAPLNELYQKYIGHDNNRDAYMLNMIESRVVARTWRHWEPQIIYVQHQTSPFPTRIWLPPFAEPIATYAPPLMSREVNTIGMAIAQGLESNGQPGATHMGTGYDAWYPGYIDYMPMMQNIASFWTETALYSYATPRFYTLADFPPDMRDLRPQSLYPSPWKGGWWRLRDAVDYMLTASMSVLDYASKYREDLLYNRYQAGRNTIAKYRAGPPFAWLVPQDQRDPFAAVELLRRFAFNGIRISQLTGDASFDGMSFPRGTWVIPMDQEFGELARQLLEPQEYPDLREFPDGPPEQPYDAAGWTLPFQMELRVVPVRSPIPDATRAAMRPIEGMPSAAADEAPFTMNAVAAGIMPPAPRVTGSGGSFAVDAAQNNASRAVNRALAGGGTVRLRTGPGLPARYIISGIANGTLRGWTEELALRGERTGDARGARVRSRVALYKPWRANMDEGWTRWLLEQYDFDFATITNEDIRAGRLLERFDVIMLADDSNRGIMEGFASGTVPPRYAGGVGESGVRALDAFVRAGGTLVCVNGSSSFAIQQLRLPVRDVLEGVPRREFFASGSILEIVTDPAHPVMAGMPEHAKVFVDRSPAFTTLDGFEGVALAKYADSGSPLLSGYLLGATHLNGHAAALDVHHGAGHVVLIGFRPQWRGQPFGTFKVIFNSALFGGEVAATATATPGFWTGNEAPPAAR